MNSSSSGSNASPDDRSLVRQTIRILFPPSPPEVYHNCKHFPTYNPSIECPFPGWVLEVVALCAEYAKLDIVPVFMESDVTEWNLDFGTYRNGTWSGVLGRVAAGEVDTASVLFRYSRVRARHFAFSLPTISVQDVFVAKPKRKSLLLSLWSAFDPYEPAVWLLLLMALLAHSGLATLVSRFEFSLGLRPRFDVGEKFWQYLRLQTQQHLYFDRLSPFFTLRSGKVAFILYALLQATLFANLYTEILLSALIQQQNSKPWTNFREMVTLIKAKGELGSERVTHALGWRREGVEKMVKYLEYSLVMDRHEYEKDIYSFASRMRNRNVTSVRILRDAVNFNPVVIVPTIKDALDYVERGGYIFYTQASDTWGRNGLKTQAVASQWDALTEVTSCLVFQQNSPGFYFAEKRCNLYHFVDDQGQAPEYFLFGANHPLLPRWNLAVRNNQHFIRKTFEKYFHKGYHQGVIPKCPDSDYYITETNRPLDLTATFGIFMIAAMGFAIAVLVFFLELYIHRKTSLFKWRAARRDQYLHNTNAQ